MLAIAPRRRRAGDAVPRRPRGRPAASSAANPVPIPGFWDPRRRPERPDLSRVTLIRFLTEIDYPPFNYAGPDGNPAGFNVDLARMICEELKIACTVQMRRFDTLLAALDENRGDAVMASIAVTPEARKLADFSDPYYRTPARFVARRDVTIDEVRPELPRRQGGCGGRRHRARGVPQEGFHRGELAALRHAGAGARGAAQRRSRV